MAARERVSWEGCEGPRLLQGGSRDVVRQRDEAMGCGAEGTSSGRVGGVAASTMSEDEQQTMEVFDTGTEVHRLKWWLGDWFVVACAYGRHGGR